MCESWDFGVFVRDSEAAFPGTSLPCWGHGAVPGTGPVLLSSKLEEAGGDTNTLKQPTGSHPRCLCRLGQPQTGSVVLPSEEIRTICEFNSSRWRGTGKRHILYVVKNNKARADEDLVKGLRVLWEAICREEISSSCLTQREPEFVHFEITGA